MTIFYYPELERNQYDPQGPAARMPLPGFFKCSERQRFHRPEILTPTKTPTSLTLTCRMCSKK